MYAMHDQHLFLKMKISLANVLRGKKCIQQFFFVCEILNVRRTLFDSTEYLWESSTEKTICGSYPFD